MKIRVLRDYSGEEGTAPDYDVLAGEEHRVTRVRGAALAANGLIEIIDDEAEEGDALTTEQKAAEPVQNKAAPEAKNKAATKPAVKA